MKLHKKIAENKARSRYFHAIKREGKRSEGSPESLTRKRNLDRIFAGRETIKTLKYAVRRIANRSSIWFDSLNVKWEVLVRF